MFDALLTFFLINIQAIELCMLERGVFIFDDMFNMIFFLMKKRSLDFIRVMKGRSVENSQVGRRNVQHESLRCILKFQWIGLTCDPTQLYPIKRDLIHFKRHEVRSGSKIGFISFFGSSVGLVDLDPTWLELNIPLGFKLVLNI